jgi:hypothetical protein
MFYLKAFLENPQYDPSDTDRRRIRGYVDRWIICMAKLLLKLLSLTPRYQTRTKMLQLDKC